MVAAHEEDRRQVFGQHLQPGHVEGAGHRPLPGQRQASARDGGGVRANGGQSGQSVRLRHTAALLISEWDKPEPNGRY